MKHIRAQRRVAKIELDRYETAKRVGYSWKGAKLTAPSCVPSYRLLVKRDFLFTK